jgi:hypothetical protein
LVDALTPLVELAASAGLCAKLVPVDQVTHGVRIWERHASAEGGVIVLAGFATAPGPARLVVCDVRGPSGESISVGLDALDAGIRRFLARPALLLDRDAPLLLRLFPTAPLDPPRPAMAREPTHDAPPTVH